MNYLTESKLKGELLYRNIERKLKPYAWATIGGLVLYTIGNVLTLASLPVIVNVIRLN